MGPRHTRPAQRMIRLAWFRSPKRITLIPPQPVIEVSCGIFAAGVGSLAVSRKFRNSSGNVLNFTFYFNNRRERRWRRLRFLAPRLLACLALRLALGLPGFIGLALGQRQQPPHLLAQLPRNTVRKPPR